MPLPIGSLRAGPAGRDSLKDVNPTFALGGKSSLDWCEENYAHSGFTAEFWNTLSGFVMVVGAIHGLYSARKFGLEQRFVVAFLGMLSIGVGTVAFHVWLTYAAQLSDEIPMIWGTCSFLYCLRPAQLTPWKDKVLKITLTLYASVVSVLYTTFLKHEPVFLEATYGLLVFVIIGASIRGLITAPAIYQRVFVGLAARGYGCYGIGFALWNVDNLFCGNLREFRSTMPAPMRPIFQLHAWWHVGQIAISTTILGGAIRSHLGELSVEYVCFGMVPVLIKMPSKKD